MTRTVVRQDVATDPLVWCDCFREQVRLSVKVNGGACVVCQKDAGEEVTEISPSLRAALEKELDGVEDLRAAFCAEIAHHEDEISRAEKELSQLNERADAIRDQLGGASC